MSTRCVVNFCSGKNIIAKVYRHYDGYPNGDTGMIASLNQFFEDVKKETQDTRFTDPSYLAAKFVVWQANEYSRKPGSLEFSGVGVVLQDPGDIEYIWFVNCNNVSEPEVTYKKV